MLICRIADAPTCLVRRRENAASAFVFTENETRYQAACLHQKLKELMIGQLGISLHRQVIEIRNLTPGLRRKLKKPLGILLHGSLEDIIHVLTTLIEKEQPTKIVAVGDQVSQDLTNYHLMPDVLIVDNRIMRKEIRPISATADQIISVKNLPGTISDEAWLATKAAMANKRRTKIVVDGEEDLLTLVAVLTAPENSLVIYGQPQKGVVAVKATSKMKEKVKEIVEAMKHVEEVA